MKRDTVRIVGGGISGLTAGIVLARGGRDVEIFERRRAAMTHPLRWDAVENWSTTADLSEFFAHWSLDATPFRAVSNVEVHAFDGEMHAFAHPRPLLYVVKRGDDPGSLDTALARQALELGVRIHRGTTLARADADIWAAGVQRRGFFLDTGITFRTTAPDRFAILVDRQLTPNVCAYLIIVDGIGTLAVLLTRRFRDARALLDNTRAAFQRIQPFAMQDVRMRSGIGGAMHALLARAAGPLVIGEAAGLLDYLWGFGIRYAMLSGALAAQALLEQTDYEALLARELRPLVLTSLVNRRLYDYADNKGYRALIRFFGARQQLHTALQRFYRSRGIRARLWPWAIRSLDNAAA